MEALYTVSGWRVPFVLVNVSRGLSAPITLGPDHNDVLAARDAGFAQIHCETCQEVLDSVLMAFRIAEDPRVSLPVLVNLDGFFLSFTREGVEIPAVDQVAEFLPPFEPNHPPFRASQPIAQGVAVLDGPTYSYFRYQMHRSMENVLEVHAETADAFADRFGRRYGALECYKLDDAEFAIVMVGSFATKGKAAVNRWRAQGHRVGLLRLRLVRPFPVQEVADALRGRRAIGVIDQNISPGLGGIVFHELAAGLAGAANVPALRSFIGGLGGKDISRVEFDHILETLLRAQAGDGRIEPELLMTCQEFEQVQRRLETAGKPVEVVTSCE
jgi:pyruvate ferredoxin oxidoreductase alpha subunit